MKLKTHFIETVAVYLSNSSQNFNCRKLESEVQLSPGTGEFHDHLQGSPRLNDVK